MLIYLVRRLLIMIPTLFGITLCSFVVINLTPGSPVEQRLQAIEFGGGSRGDGGVSQEVVDALNKQYGFDKPLHVRYGIWLKNLARFDFGESFKFEEPVSHVIFSRLPVSLSFGLTSVVLLYLICIPLGVMKAAWNQSKFDRATSYLLFASYSIPPLILGILCLVFIAGSSYLDLFPIGGIYSDTYNSLSFWGKFTDRAHHMALPVACYVASGIAFVTLLMKGSMLDVLGLDYIRTARAKGLSSQRVHLKHALRNALIPVLAGMSGILNVFFTGSIVIERIFNIDGMGLLTFNAVSARDYNVLMGLIFFQSALFLASRLLTDFLYSMVDPRIDFA